MDCKIEFTILQSFLISYATALYLVFIPVFNKTIEAVSLLHS